MTTVEKLQKKSYQSHLGQKRDMLAAIAENTRVEGATLSNLNTKTGMAYDVSLETLEYLKRNGMVVQHQHKNRCTFTMTTKGVLYLAKLNELKAMVESVGMKL